MARLIQNDSRMTVDATPDQKFHILATDLVAGITRL